MMVGMTEFRPPPPPRIQPPVRDTSAAAVVLVATFAGAPVIVALMIPEIYRWLRRTL